MLQRPDPQGFTKFLTSVGLFLCIVALVGPGLVLRETDVLQIKERDLRAQTSLARKELERRQAIARDVAWAAPFVGGVVFLLGVGVLVYSIPRLKRQEGTEDERVKAELEKLKREVAPQDASERRARIEAEVAESSAEITDGDAPDRDEAIREEEAAQASDGGATEPEDGSAAPPLAGQSHDQADLVRRVADMEERVLLQIARIAPPLYEFRAQVRVGRSSFVSYFDGLLVSSIDQLPDVAVEIKFVRATTNLTRRVREALHQLERYRTSASLSNAKLWLIVVTVTELNTADLERVAEVAARSGDDVIVSVIQESRIEELELPRDRLL